MPTPVPRVRTSSKPLPATTAAPWISASLATLVGLPMARASSDSRSKAAQAVTSFGTGVPPGPSGETKCGADRCDAAADHAREIRRHPVKGRQRLDQVHQHRDQLLGRQRVRRGNPHPVVLHVTALIEHGGLEARAADVDGEGGDGTAAPRRLAARAIWLDPVADPVDPAAACLVAALSRRRLAASLGGQPPARRSLEASGSHAATLPAPDAWPSGGRPPDGLVGTLSPSFCTSRWPKPLRRVENGRDTVGSRSIGDGPRGGEMSTRDDASLNARERAALASLEAQAAAEDPQLARRLRGSNRFRLVTTLPRVPAWLWQSWWGAPVAVVGLALMVLGLSTGLVVGLVGAVMATAGLAHAGRRRPEARRASSSPPVERGRPVGFLLG